MDRHNDSRRRSTRKTHRDAATTRRKNRHVGTEGDKLAYSIHIFFNMLMNISLYHWSTTNYARHTSSGALYDTVSLLVDQFIETYMGRYKRPEFEQDTFTVDVKQFNDTTIIDALKEYIQFLEHKLPLYVSDSDLLNIRDEILAEINKTLYLFTLH